MRAYVLNRYGGPEGSLLTDVPPPVLRPRDILVGVRAVGLNPVDYKFRQGQLRVISRPRLPLVLGNDLAGEVLAVGEKVTKFSPGDRVFARVDKDRLGAFAEQAAVAEDFAALLPRTLDFAQAAAVPLASLTALQALRDELAVAAGQRIVISGGAGGVGTFAIQIAKWLGAHVTTTASPRGEALVRELGADEVFDYTAGDLRALGKTFDAGFDLVGGKTLEQMFGVVKSGRKIVSVAAMPAPETALRDLGGRKFLAALFWFASFGIRRQARLAGVGYRYLFMHPSGSDLTLLADLIARGIIRVVVDKSYAFADIAAALDHVESGRAKGKVVVTVAP